MASCGLVANGLVVMPIVLEVWLETIKVRATIGEHKFEAEGPTEVVRYQFKVFSEIVRAAASSKVGLKTTEGISHAAGFAEDELPPAALSGIMELDGRVVYLTLSGSTAAEAALLIMLGQRELRRNLSSTGQEISDGLVRSGYSMPRVYRLLAKEMKEQLIVTVGERRSMRYRLTTLGLQRAHSLARALTSQELVSDPKFLREDRP